MADKKVAITCEGFKARRQEGNGYEAGPLTDIPGLQEIGMELEQGNEPVHADGVKKLNLFSGITGATVTANLMELNKESKYVVFGPEPLFTYLVAKEREINAVRMIMVSKINNISSDKIRERLRETYV